MSQLKALIEKCRRDYQPEVVVTDFKRRYPALYHGDLTALQTFLDKVAGGDITGETHRQHAVLNKGIISH